MRKCLFGLAVATAVVVFSPGAAQANVLANPGFEAPDASAGDIFATNANSSWNGFNAAFITASTKRTGLQSLKTFGAPGGAFQDFPSAPGDTWTGTVYGENLSTDAMTGSQAGFINIEWHDAGGALISFLSTKVVDSTSPFDTWIQGNVNGIAPAGTAVARLVLLSGPFNGSGNGGGATFFDDSTFDVVRVPEPASIGLLGMAGMTILVRRQRRAC